MALEAKDCRPRDSRLLRKVYRLQVLRQGGPLLVDKLPINSFRIDFLRGIWPEARFLHIVREGREVARSIEKLADRKEWFGASLWKWRLLAEHARSEPGMGDVESLCASNYERGLLEWRLSVGAVADYFDAHPEVEHLNLSYSAFVEDPAETLRACLAFVGAREQPDLLEHARSTIARRTPRASGAEITHREAAIAGDLLERHRES